MRNKITTVMFLSVFVVGVAVAQDYRGIVVSTDYPSITTSSRDLIVLDLEVSDYGVAPQRVDLSLVDAKPAWDYAFVGGGGLVDAVFAAPETPADAQLWIDPPDDVATGQYNFTVRGSGSFGRYDLPVTIEIGDRLPRRLVLKPELPDLSGAASADFTFQATLTNRSAQEGLVDLRAEAPERFQVSFKKRYADQELTSIPVDAGADVKLEIKVEPPSDVAAGSYPVQIVAKSGDAETIANLSVIVRGQPELSLAGPDGRLSETAVAGRAQTIDLTVTNDGAEAATDVKLRGSAPRNWEVTFSPETLDTIAPGDSADVIASITPGSEAITGDYNVTIRANGADVRTSEQFRITVRTSALWGVVALVIIALALAVVILAVRRYGRR